MTTSYRWDVASRVVLAIVGGFAWVSACGALCATLLAKVEWLPLAQGVHVMTLLGFVAWCGVAMWVFYRRRLSEVAAVLIGSTVVLLGLNTLVA